MKTRLICAAFAAVAMSLLWSFTQRHNTSIEARVREMETGVPAWDAGTAKDAVSKANESWHEGHSRLGMLLKRQGRLGKSLAVYEEEVRRWPWNHRAVDSCLWLVTHGMTQFLETVTRAA